MIEEIRLAWLSPSNALRPGQHLVEHGAEREDVRPASASLPSSCSGAMYWNVPRMCLPPSAAAPSAASTPAPRRAGRALGKPEVEKLGPGLGEHDVAGLQIAMNDPGAMGLSSASAISIAMRRASVERQAPRARAARPASPPRDTP